MVSILSLILKKCDEFNKFSDRSSMAKAADPPHCTDPAPDGAGYPKRIRVIQLLSKGCVTAHSFPDSALFHSNHPKFRRVSEEKLYFCHFVQVVGSGSLMALGGRLTDLIYRFISFFPKILVCVYLHQLPLLCQCLCPKTQYPDNYVWAGYQHLFSPCFRSPLQHRASQLGHFPQDAPGCSIILLGELLGQAEFLHVLSQVTF